MLNRLEVDRAVFFALSTRLWQFVAGPVTLLLIASWFTPEVQGYFYTFGSLLALQAVVELGLSTLIVILASFESATLKWDADRGEVLGDAAALSRLQSLAALFAPWYAVAGLVFVAAVGAAGAVFFAQSGDARVDWAGPWWVVVGLTGLSLWFMPFMALLEGCNQVVAVHKVRFVQGVLGNIAVWVCIPLGADLWTVVAAAAVKTICEATLIFGRYGRFFRSLFRAAGEFAMDWRREVWPLQSRLAAQSLVVFFSSGLLNPVIFHYHGAAAAGRTGMTWSILTTLQTAALAWVQTRVPRFGMLIARREYGELDRIWRRVTLVSLGVLAAGVGAVVLIVWALNSLAWVPTTWDSPVLRLLQALEERMLGPLPTLILGLAIVLWHVPICQALYVRAHRRDPFPALSIPGTLLLGLLVWLLGSRYGPLGAAIGYVLVIGGIFVPGFDLIWRWTRAAHQESANNASRPD